jgi:hypothetical protein
MKHQLGGLGAACAKRALIALLGAALTGCAGGPWTASLSDEELPLDAEVSPYPTVVDPDAPPPVVRKPLEQSHKLPATPLAAVPAHLRNIQKPPEPIPLPTQQPAEAIAITMPASAPAKAPSPPPASAASAAMEMPPPAQPMAEPAAAPPTPPLPPIVSPASVQLAAGPNTVQPLAAPAVPPASAAPPTAVGNASAVAIAGEDRQAAIDRSRADLIAALEAEIRGRRSQNPQDEELPRLEQQLRLVYLAADRLDDAALGVESLDEPQREGFKHAMFGLGVWMSPDEARRAPLRSAKVLRSLREATAELAAASKLELRTVAFCERVEQFGWYAEFPRNEFRPKQQVILYVEVENFAAERKGQGYETELQGSYQIFDAGGRIVAERQLPLDREICRNYRRDYFLAYPMYLPDSIEPGRYRLELTIEDLKSSGEYQGRKFGEGMIEFTIRQ